MAKETVFHMLFNELKKFVKFLLWIPKTLFKKISKETQVKASRPKKIPAVYEPFEEVQRDTGTLEEWERDLLKSDSKIGIIVGARGKGKTAMGLKLLENVHAKTKKKCYALGFQEDLPSWIHTVEDVEKIKNGFVLIDEGGILFSSRKSMSKPNQMLSDLILVARHKNLSIIFISQNSSNLDVNILRQADYLILKPSSLLQMDFERKKIKEIYEEIHEDFERYKDRKGITYIYNDNFQGFVENPLPSFWSTKISKSFK